MDEQTKQPTKQPAVPVIDLNRYRLSKISARMRAAMHPKRVIITHLKTPNCFHMWDGCPEVKKSTGWAWVTAEQLNNINILRGTPLPVCQYCAKAREKFLAKLHSERAEIVAFIGPIAEEAIESDPVES